jgi:microfibrillar-associated protein 1
MIVGILHVLYSDRSYSTCTEYSERGIDSVAGQSPPQIFWPLELLSSPRALGSRMSSTRAGGVGLGGKDGRMEKVSVHRHWPGKRPDWAQEEEEGDLEETIAARNTVGSNLQPVRSDFGGRAGVTRRREICEAEVVEDDEGSEDDQGENEIDARRAKARARAREVAAAESGDDEEEISARRARARGRLQERQAEEVLEVEDESEDAESDGSSEWETETESEEDTSLWGVRRLAKPVFVRKSERESKIEQEKQEEKDDQIWEEKQQRKEDRKIETRQKIASVLQHEQEGGSDAEETDPMPDDNDDADEAAMYEAWKIRELRRIKREFDARAKIKADKADIERRRKMTDAEIAEEDQNAFKNKKDGMKEEKWGFMQKYYHRGAFFQDTNDEGTGMAEPLYQRDIGGKTGQDNFNIAAMPKVLQKRGYTFGKTSQVKWTHLVDNDTTLGGDGKSNSLRGDSAFAVQRTKDRLARSGGLLEKPTRKKVKL